MPYFRHVTSGLLGLFLVSAFSTLPAAESPPAPAPAPVAVQDFKEPIRVACVGDSITQGVGASDGNSYPAQLGKMLGEKWKIGNFGVSGTTMLKKGDSPYWKQGAFTKAQESGPNVVIIMLGTNDTKPQNWKIKDDYGADCREMVATFQKLASKPRVYVCRPCPVVGNGNWGLNEPAVLELIPVIDKVAAELKLDVIDMHAALAGRPELIPDRVHPNTGGAEAMAKAAFRALTGGDFSPAK
jgi:lysophospholipase L1-like esterase